MAGGQPPYRKTRDGQPAPMKLEIKGGKEQMWATSVALGPLTTPSLALQWPLTKISCEVSGCFETGNPQLLLYHFEIDFMQIDPLILLCHFNIDFMKTHIWAQENSRTAHFTSPSCELGLKYFSPKNPLLQISKDFGFSFLPVVN